MSGSQNAAAVIEQARPLSPLPPTAASSDIRSRRGHAQVKAEMANAYLQVRPVCLPQPRHGKLLTRRCPPPQEVFTVRLQGVRRRR